MMKINAVNDNFAKMRRQVRHSAENLQMQFIFTLNIALGYLLVTEMYSGFILRSGAKTFTKRKYSKTKCTNQIMKIYLQFKIHA